MFRSQINDAVLTQSVRENLQTLNSLVLVELQTINTVKTIVLDQVESWVHWNLVQTKNN